MKWFKHFSKMRLDLKVERLLNEYGVEGYGVYNYILECIAFNLEPENPVPEIEENSQDLSRKLKIDTLKLEKIIDFCVKENLFEINPENNRIMCLKILTHLDNTLSNNPEIKKILGNFNKLKETSSNLKQIRLDKIRLDKNKEDKETIYTSDYFTISKKQHEEYARVYKNVDIINEYCKMKLWLDVNPTKRKTDRGYQKFVNSWLSRANEQNKNKCIEVKEIPSISVEELKRKYGEDIYDN